MRAGQPPADLDIRRVSKRLQPAEADHLMGVRLQESPHAVPAFANAGHLTPDEVLDAIVGPGKSLADVPHHFGIGGDGLEGELIGFRPWGEEEPLSLHGNGVSVSRESRRT